MSQGSDREDVILVREALGGSPHSLGELFNRHKDSVYNLSFRMTGCRQDAEDILHDSFLKAFQKLDSFKVDGVFRNWIFTIALNKSRNLLRRKKLLRFLPLVSLTEEGEQLPLQIRDPGMSPEDELIVNEDSRLIGEIVGALPEKYRTLIVLRHMEGLSYEEIAEITGLPLGTVENRLFRARQRLVPVLKKKFRAAEK